MKPLDVTDLTAEELAAMGITRMDGLSTDELAAMGIHEWTPEELEEMELLKADMRRLKADMRRLMEKHRLRIHQARRGLRKRSR